MIKIIDNVSSQTIQKNEIEVNFKDMNEVLLKELISAIKKCNYYLEK